LRDVNATPTREAKLIMATGRHYVYQVCTCDLYYAVYTEKLKVLCYLLHSGASLR
jgi:hypothetical protein